MEDLLFERGVDICHETVRLWWNRLGLMFAADIRCQRVDRMRGVQHWRWHLDEMYAKLNSEMVNLWRAVLKSLQKFASVHDSLHNHFSQDRHLVDRQSYFSFAARPRLPSGETSWG